MTCPSGRPFVRSFTSIGVSPRVSRSRELAYAPRPHIFTFFYDFFYQIDVFLLGKHESPAHVRVVCSLGYNFFYDQVEVFLFFFECLNPSLIVNIS